MLSWHGRTTGVRRDDGERHGERLCKEKWDALAKRAAEAGRGSEGESEWGSGCDEERLCCQVTTLPPS